MGHCESQHLALLALALHMICVHTVIAGPSWDGTAIKLAFNPSFGLTTRSTWHLPGCANLHSSVQVCRGLIGGRQHVTVGTLGRPSTLFLSGRFSIINKFCMKAEREDETSRRGRKGNPGTSEETKSKGRREGRILRREEVKESKMKQHNNKVVRSNSHTELGSLESKASRTARRQTETNTTTNKARVRTQRLPMHGAMASTHPDEKSSLNTGNNHHKRTKNVVRMHPSTGTKGKDVRNNTATKLARTQQASDKARTKSVPRGSQSTARQQRPRTATSKREGGRTGADHVSASYVSDDVKPTEGVREGRKGGGRQRSLKMTNTKTKSTASNNSSSSRRSNSIQRAGQSNVTTASTAKSTGGCDHGAADGREEGEGLRRVKGEDSAGPEGAKRLVSNTASDTRMLERRRGEGGQGSNGKRVGGERREEEMRSGKKTPVTLKTEVGRTGDLEGEGEGEEERTQLKSLVEGEERDAKRAVTEAQREGGGNTTVLRKPTARAREESNGEGGGGGGGGPNGKPVMPETVSKSRESVSEAGREERGKSVARERGGQDGGGRGGTKERVRARAGGKEGGRRRRGGRYNQKQPKESLYSVALRHQKRRNYGAARRLFSMLVTSPEGEGQVDARVFVAWGRMESRLGNVGKARRVFAEGLRAEPENTHVIHAWAVEEMRENNLDDSRQLFEYGIEVAPEDGMLYQSYSLLEQRQNNVDKARSLLEAGVAADPTNVYLWSACGVFESKYGDPEAALRMFEQATVLDQKHCQTWQAYGVVLEKMGRYDEAASKFATAIQVNQLSVPTYQAYGLMEARRGRYEAARLLFTKGLQLDGTHAPILHAWARMEEEAGEYAKARELFNKGVEVDPMSVAMLKAWALMELRLGHIDSSNQWYVHSDMGKGRLGRMGERLEMLRRLVEQRTADDVKSVMQWLNRQKVYKERVLLSQIMQVGNRVPDGWTEGEEYSFRDNNRFNSGEVVVTRSGSAVSGRNGQPGLTFGRIMTRLQDAAASEAGQRFTVEVVSAPPAWSTDPRGGQQRPVQEVYQRGQIGKVDLARAKNSETVEEEAIRAMKRREGGREAAGQPDSVPLRGVASFVNPAGIDLIDRYGEDMYVYPYNYRAVDELANFEEETIREQRDALQMIEQWVARRSDDDVANFRRWFNAMYQEDKEMPMKMLDWDFNPKLEEAEALQAPREWTSLQDLRAASEVESKTESVATQRKKLYRIVEERIALQPKWIRVIEGLVLLSLFAGGLSAAPDFFAHWVQRGDPSMLPQYPSGVDADLIQTDFSSQELTILPNLKPWRGTKGGQEKNGGGGAKFAEERAKGQKQTAVQSKKIEEVQPETPQLKPSSESKFQLRYQSPPFPNAPEPLPPPPPPPPP